jgi:hypothetical protein
MDPDWVPRISRVIALVPKQVPFFYKDLEGARGEGIHDIRRSLGVGKVSVIGPDLEGRMQRILRDADDEGRFPITKTGQVTGVSSIYRGDAISLGCEDIDALVGVTGAEGVSPYITDVPICGDQEGC